MSKSKTIEKLIEKNQRFNKLLREGHVEFDKKIDSKRKLGSRRSAFSKETSDYFQVFN